MTTITHDAPALSHCDGCDQDQAGVEAHRIHLRGRGWETCRWCPECAATAAVDVEDGTTDILRIVRVEVPAT